MGQNLLLRYRVLGFFGSKFAPGIRIFFGFLKKNNNSKYPNNVGTCFDVLGKDFLILCLVNFDQKTAVLEHFS